MATLRVLASGLFLILSVGLAHGAPYKYNVVVTGLEIGREVVLTIEYTSKQVLIVSDPQTVQFSVEEGTDTQVFISPPSCVACNVTSESRNVTTVDKRVSMPAHDVLQGPTVQCWRVAAKSKDLGCFQLSGMVQGLKTPREFEISFTCSNSARCPPGEDKRLLGYNGDFVVKSGLDTGDSYELTVADQPNGHVCTVERGKGVVAAKDIKATEGPLVQCTLDQYYIKGQAWGLLAGEKVTLALVLLNVREGDAAPPPERTASCIGPGTQAAPCKFSFGENFETQDKYQVRVASGGTPSRTGETYPLSCTVYRAGGIIENKDIDDVVVECLPSRIGATNPNAPKTFVSAYSGVARVVAMRSVLAWVAASALSLMAAMLV